MYQSEFAPLRHLQKTDLIDAASSRAGQLLIYEPGGRRSTRRRMARTFRALPRRIGSAVARRRPAGLDPALEPFVGLSARQLRRLPEYLALHDVPVGTALGYQGDMVSSFVVILGGHVGVTIDDEPVAVLDEGSQFGALPLLNPGAYPGRHASFHTMTDCTIAIASHAQFLALLEDLPPIRKYVRQIADRRREYLASRAAASDWSEEGVLDLTYPAHVGSSSTRSSLPL